MTVTAIAAVLPRRRTTVRGEVVTLVSYERPWVRMDAEIADRTGSMLLRFSGRVAIPGLVVGSHVEAEGTPSCRRGVLVMLDPRYSFTRSG